MIIDNTLFYVPFYDTHIHPIIFHPLIHLNVCIYAIENITKEGEEKGRDKGVSVI